MKIKHIVLLKFKTNVSEVEIKKYFNELAGLENSIPGIISFKSGAYNSSEGLNQGFTHAFEINFINEASRDSYLKHPKHGEIAKNIVESIGGLNNVIAFDFVSEFSMKKQLSDICDAVTLLLEIPDAHFFELHKAQIKLLEMKTQVERHPNKFTKHIPISQVISNSPRILVINPLTRIQRLIKDIDEKLLPITNKQNKVTMTTLRAKL